MWGKKKENLGIKDNDEFDHGVNPEDTNIMGYQKN